MDIEGTYLNIINAIYYKIIVYIILKSENLKDFLLSWELRQRCLLSLFLFNAEYKFIPTAIRQEKQNKIIQIGREEVKLSPPADDMTLYIENPNVS